MKMTDSAELNTGHACLIIAGGEFAPLPAGLSFDYCIACDRGFEYADRLSVKTDLIVGDFDSASHMPAGDIPVVKLPVIKDDTDTMHAVRIALEKGFTDLYIVCAFGGRLDHTVANIQTAAFVRTRGGHCHVYGREAALTVIQNEEIRLPRMENSYLSVFAFGGSCTGVSLAGTKYDVTDVNLEPSFPLGVSNEWVSEEAVVAVKSGMLAVIRCTKD